MTQNNEIVNKLRSSQLRPTKQRIRIAEFLFKREKTFHFTVEKLNKIINKKDFERISLATIYNTIDAFKKAGHLKEILTNNNTSYFDTNINSHHHFYDENTHELTDCDVNNIDSIKIKNNITGKKINSVEVLIKVASDNQNQN